MSDVPQIVEENNYDSLKESKELRDQARHMYYSGIFPTEIAEKLNVDINELGYYVFGADKTGDSPSCWFQRRLNNPSNSFITYERVKPYVLKSTEAKLMDRVHSSVDKMIEDKKVFENIGEIQTAVSTIEKIDKITRLEEGKATAHIQSSRKSFTLREIVDGMEPADESEESYMHVEGSGERAEASEEEAGGSDLAPDSDGRTWDIRNFRSEAQPEDSGVFLDDKGKIQK